jgi:hypothetical protein
MRPVVFIPLLMLCDPSALALALAQAREAAGHWILSETTSPVNYSPLVIATTSSRSDWSGMLSIACRNGRTEVAIANIGSSSRARRNDDILVTRQVSNQPAVEERWKLSAAGKGAVFAGDVVSFLRSLPDQGEMSVRVFDSEGVPHEARFLLDGLSFVRDKVATTCKWPGASGAPRQ